MDSSYFTFGQEHLKGVNNHIFNRNTVVLIITKPGDEKTPRDVMFEFFGRQWSFEYKVMKAESLQFFKEVVTMDAFGNIHNVESVEEHALNQPPELNTKNERKQDNDT